MPDASSDVPPSLYPTVLTVWKTYFSRASVRSAHNGHHHVQDQNLHSLRPDDADEGFFLAYLLIRHVLQLHPQIRVQLKLSSLESIRKLLPDVCSITRGPAKPISAPGSARIISPSIAKLAVTPPVVGSVRTGI